MKLIINRDYGGYGFSQKVYLWLIAHKGWTVDPYSHDELDANAKLFEIHPNEYVMMDEESSRTDPDVIECVELLGDQARDWLHNPKVIEIPDNIKWHVVDRNGWEHIAEDHRTWS